jgi:hypothetical protein
MSREITNNDDENQYVPTDKAGLVRDTYSKAIISSDNKALQEYRIRAQKIKENQSKIESINTVKEEMDILKEEMDEIKNLLKQIISGTKEDNTDAS